MKRTLVAFATLLLAQLGMAQTLTYEKVLIPVWSSGETAGAFGSRWVTELSVFTKTPHIYVEGLRVQCNILCTPTGIPTNKTLAPTLGFDANPAVLLIVDEAKSAAVRYNLRVRDLSRQAENWGVEIPVVRERDAAAGTLQLLDVPVEQHFRHHLRIYDFRPNRSNPSVVSLRLWAYLPQEWHATPSGPYEADRLVFEETLTLGTLIRPNPEFDLGYAERNFLASVATTRPGERLRVEIEPLTPGHAHWAFLAITNNVTQQVTTVTPQ